MPIDRRIKSLLAETELSLHPDSFSIVSINRSEEDKAKGIVADLDNFASLTFDFA
jgi:hypothetical protein